MISSKLNLRRHDHTSGSDLSIGASSYLARLVACDMRNTVYYYATSSSTMVHLLIQFGLCVTAIPLLHRHRAMLERQIIEGQATSRQQEGESMQTNNRKGTPDLGCLPSANSLSASCHKRWYLPFLSSTHRSNDNLRCITRS